MLIKANAYLLFDGITLLRILPYAVLTVVFYSKRDSKKCFFIWETKENKKIQYHWSYISYKSHIQLQS